MGEIDTWLASHAAQCRTTAERWLLDGLPVPVDLLVQVWPDDAWHRVVTNLVLRAQGGTGFLRAAERGRGIELLGTDGATTWVTGGAVAVPHPAQLPDRDRWREAMSAHGLDQGVKQLRREVFDKPASATGNAVYDYDGARFERLQQALSRCERLGFRVRDGLAVCEVREGGTTVRASFWVGDHNPSEETFIGPLEWKGCGGQLPVAAVGPVAYSEGVRMAALIHAGAQPASQEQAPQEQASQEPASQEQAAVAVR